MLCDLTGTSAWDLAAAGFQYIHNNARQPTSRAEHKFVAEGSVLESSSFLFLFCNKIVLCWLLNVKNITYLYNLFKVRYFGFSDFALGRLPMLWLKKIVVIHILGFESRWLTVSSTKLC